MPMGRVQRTRVLVSLFLPFQNMLLRTRLLATQRMFGHEAYAAYLVGAVSVLTDGAGVSAQARGLRLMSTATHQAPRSEAGSDPHASEWMHESAQRSRQALQDAMTVVNAYGATPGPLTDAGYHKFWEQVIRGAAVLEDVSTVFVLTCLCVWCASGPIRASFWK